MRALLVSLMFASLLACQNQTEPPSKTENQSQGPADLSLENAAAATDSDYQPGPVDYRVSQLVHEQMTGDIPGLGAVVCFRDMELSKPDLAAFSCLGLGPHGQVLQGITGYTEKEEFLLAAN